MSREPNSIVRSVYDVAIREINDLELRIVEAEDDTDAKLWKQAKKVAEQLSNGMTMRDLASQWENIRLGRPYDHTHVFIVQKVFSQLNSAKPRPRFRDAYNQIAHPARARDVLDPEPFHWLNAVGDLRDVIEKAITSWPEEVRALAPKALRDLAAILEGECSDATRGDRDDRPNAGQSVDIADHASRPA